MNIPPFVTYSLARIALFAVTLLFLLLALPQLNLLIVVAIAALVSGILSYYVLAGPREALARSVEGRVRSGRERMTRMAAAEDDADGTADGSGQGSTEGNTGRRRSDDRVEGS